MMCIAYCVEGEVEHKECALDMFSRVVLRGDLTGMWMKINNESASEGPARLQVGSQCFVFCLKHFFR